MKKALVTELQPRLGGAGNPHPSLLFTSELNDTEALQGISEAASIFL